MHFILNETVSRVRLFPSAPYTVYTCGSTLRSHEYDLLYLSALAANNKMDLVTKASHFYGSFLFFMLKMKQHTLNCSGKINWSKCTGHVIDV